LHPRENSGLSRGTIPTLSLTSRRGAPE
jgi:hypothetical protein